MVTALINRLLGAQAPTHPGSVDIELIRRMQGMVPMEPMMREPQPMSRFKVPTMDWGMTEPWYQEPGVNDFMQYWPRPSQGPL